MKRRKKGLTVLFSFIPGAGQMFQGFMRSGLILLTAFFGTILLDSISDIDALLLLLPIIWIFSFFDSINKMALDDERFAATEDKLFFEKETAGTNRGMIKFVGAAAIVVGLLAIWNVFASVALGWLSEYFTNEADMIFVNDIVYAIPKAIFALLIIAGGILLICRKKKEIKNGNDE